MGLLDSFDDLCFRSGSLSYHGSGNACPNPCTMIAVDWWRLEIANHFEFSGETHQLALMLLSVRVVNRRARRFGPALK